MTSASPSTTPSMDLNNGQPATPAPQPVAPVRPPLRRSATDKMLGGVCGGLAEHTGIDSLVWRVAFVAFTLAGGAGILVYLLLWVLMPPAPRADEQEPGRLDRLAEQAHQKVYSTGLLPPRT
jgi:phage shock protein PspC (stress-responsive transcriptional regulator)